jgi:hypothetical protein
MDREPPDRFGASFVPGVDDRQMTTTRLQQGHRQHVGLERPPAVPEHLAEQLGPALRRGQRRHGRRQPGQ